MMTPSEYYNSYKDLGICPWCHKEKAMLGNVLCFDCWKDRKKLYAWSKSIGVCPRCNKNKALEGHVMCEKCLKQISEYMKKKRKQQKQRKKK